MCNTPTKEPNTLRRHLRLRIRCPRPIRVTRARGFERSHRSAAYPVGGGITRASIQNQLARHAAVLPADDVRLHTLELLVDGEEVLDFLEIMFGHIGQLLVFFVERV